MYEEEYARLRSAQVRMRLLVRRSTALRRCADGKET
jgi:hypothetical protein